MVAIRRGACRTHPGPRGWIDIPFGPSADVSVVVLLDDQHDSLERGPITQVRGAGKIRQHGDTTSGLPMPDRITSRADLF